MIESPVKYITKVEIQGLFGRYDIVWNLNKDVNVLAGINGSGKTTILNAIYGLFMEWKTSLPCFDVTKNIKLFFNDDEFIEVTTNIKNKVKIAEGISHQKINTHIDIIHTFDSELKPQELLQKVDNDTKTELDFELWQLQKEYLNYQVNLGKKLKSNKGSPDDNSTYFHDKFLEIVDNLFLETNKKVNRDKNELEFLLGDKEINAYQLSSGEKQLLVILLTVLVQDNKSAILLMDEPEISLHIEWQRKLIKYIRELNPNAQIIIATHSPDIIIKGWLDKVVNIEDIIVKDNAVA